MTPNTTDDLPDERRPWDRRESETAPAFAAFSAYLDFGPGRTVLRVYRGHSGKPEALQASGRWNTWFVVHDWAARADTYDRHLRSERVRAFTTRSNDTHLDAYRAEAILAAEAHLEHCKVAEAMIGDALAALDLSAPKVIEVTALIRAVTTLRREAHEAYATAIGLNHLIVALNGEVLPVPAKRPGDSTRGSAGPGFGRTPGEA